MQSPFPDHNSNQSSLISLTKTHSQDTSHPLVPTNHHAAHQSSNSVANMSIHDIVEQFASYEDYLDSQILPSDRKYLQNEDLMRQLVELGYRGTQDTCRREEFDQAKKEYNLRQKIAASAAVSSSANNQTIHGKHDNTNTSSSEKSHLLLASQVVSLGYDCSGSPFLRELQKREALIRSSKLCTILFIRVLNSRGQEISGYIDLAHRLTTDNFHLYFQRREILIPKMNDLSYYNWETQVHSISTSPNFTVKSDSSKGLLFKNKKDRKIINVDPKQKSSNQQEENEMRTSITTPEYIQCVIYDRSTRYH